MLRSPEAEILTARPSTPPGKGGAGFEARQDSRFHYIGVIFLSWMDARNKNYVMGKCLDISEGGVGVELARRISVGTEVTVRADWVRLDDKATVRHITERGGVFHLGLQFKHALRADVVAQLVAPKPA